MKDKICPFCTIETRRQIIAENEHSFAIFDKYPVNPGHVLVIPKRHCSNYFDLSKEEQFSCWELVNSLRDILINNFSPDGFNIGINIGFDAGQTIFHAHIHVITRYNGDIDDPTGGVRGVIPYKQKY